MTSESLIQMCLLKIKEENCSSSSVAVLNVTRPLASKPQHSNSLLSSARLSSITKTKSMLSLAYKAPFFAANPAVYVLFT